MAYNKFILGFILASNIASNAQAVNCASDCTKEAACKFTFKRNACKQECPDFNPAICESTKPATITAESIQKPHGSSEIPTTPPRAAQHRAATSKEVKPNKPPQPKRQLPTLPGPVKGAPEITYTKSELNTLLKNLLEDYFKEVTTGCDSAVERIRGGLEMVKTGEKREVNDLLKRGLGFITLLMTEKKEAEQWVKDFDILKKLTNEDLVKYKIDKKEIDRNGKLSISGLKIMYQKSLEKSLLVKQDCKVKSDQFNSWLEEYLAKVETPEKKKFGFLRQSKKRN